MKIASRSGEAVLNRNGMATISEKLKLSLDECRMLVLGTQVLISLQFDLAFQTGFPEAPPVARQLVAVGLAFLLATFVLLLWGPAYHRITCGGNISDEAQEFMIWTMCSALAPLAVALGIDAFIAFDMVCGTLTGIVVGSIVFIFCCTAWYAFGMLARRAHPEEVERVMKDKAQEESRGSLNERVTQVMTEARVVLPGAQAMLGFQFITFFERSFEALPNYIKGVHLACASLIALTVVLLMTPAAFHRVAERGEESERLVRVAAGCVVGAMIPLAAGMSGDFFVIVMKITASVPLALAAGSITLVVFLGLWFGYTFLRRLRNPYVGQIQVARRIRESPPIR
jgi:hypothetical protein